MVRALFETRAGEVVAVETEVAFLAKPTTRIINRLSQAVPVEHWVHGDAPPACAVRVLELRYYIDVVGELGRWDLEPVDARAS